MVEETKVDKAYLEAFNLGYELAKELDLTVPMFQTIPAGNDRIGAMQSGMAEFSKERTLTLGHKDRISKDRGRDQGNAMDRSI